MGWFKDLLGGGVFGSVERIATEWIETDQEKAEAKTIMIKALDPNGAMRRQLSRDVTRLYSIYVLTMLVLIAIEFVCALFSLPVNVSALAVATEKLQQLFVPITSLFGVIVSASFGVNYANVRNEKKPD